MDPSKYALCLWPKFKVGGWVSDGERGVVGLDGRLTLGTACILARDDYVDNKRPPKERRTRGNSGLARFEVCIVRTLRGNPLSHRQIGPWNGNVANASTFFPFVDSWMRAYAGPGPGSRNKISLGRLFSFVVVFRGKLRLTGRPRQDRSRSAFSIKERQVRVRGGERGETKKIERRRWLGRGKDSTSWLSRG